MSLVRKKSVFLNQSQMSLRRYAAKNGGFYTNATKDLFHERLTRYKWIFYVEQLYMVGLMARIGLVLLGHKPPIYDPLINLIYIKLNETLFWMVMFNVALACSIFWQMFHNTSSKGFYSRYIYELIVRNSETIWGSVKSEEVIDRLVARESIRIATNHNAIFGFIPRWLSKCVLNKLAKLSIEWRSDDIDQSKMEKLTLFPNLSFHIRAKLAKMTLTFDIFGHVFFAFLCKY